MPDGGIHIALILANDAHPNLGNKIIGDDGEHALQDIGGFAVALAFQERFPQQPVRFDVLGIGSQDVLSMRDCLFYFPTLDEILYLFEICSQWNFCHIWRPSAG